MEALLSRVGGGGAEKLYVDDVFSSYLRTGTGADVTVTTGIDMTKGYMLWSKGRSGATDHAVYDSARGVTYDLVTNSTAAQTTQATGLKSVSSSGHTVGSLAKMNTSAATYVDWVFRNASKFFTHATVTKSAGSNATVDLSSLGTVGMVRVKRTDASGSWYVWHRSLSAGKLLIGETTAAEATLGHITVSGTTLTLVNGVIADGSYVVHAWAHDPSADGIIQCGSVTSAADGKIPAINLGWEPQYILYKNAGAAWGWEIWDSQRNWAIASTGNATANALKPNLSDAETSSSTAFTPTATGFYSNANFGASQTFIYLAIRRPNKPPTSGTQVYNAIARTGTSATATVAGVGFAPDLALVHMRDSTYSPFAADRLRSATSFTDGQAAEYSPGQISGWATDGVNVSSGGAVNQSGFTYINHFFRRAPGVFDVVCYTGTGAATTVAHSLGVVPELMVVKSRTAAEHWATYNKTSGATKWQILNATNADMVLSNIWNNTEPSSSVFTVGTNVYVNTSPNKYVAYLFATLAGISKVGSYTGNGSSQNIECGFSAGARFVLIKRTDSAGDWYVWDTARGIVSANDPHLSLNTTAAEVTTDDSVDPYAGGFAVNQNSATNINVSGASYIFLAYA